MSPAAREGVERVHLALLSGGAEAARDLIPPAIDLALAEPAAPDVDRALDYLERAAKYVERGRVVHA